LSRAPDNGRSDGAPPGDQWIPIPPRTGGVDKLGIMGLDSRQHHAVREAADTTEDERVESAQTEKKRKAIYVLFAALVLTVGSSATADS